MQTSGLAARLQPEAEMVVSLDDESRSLFLSEVEAGLARLEGKLLSGEGALESETIRSLFRELHSVKGACGFLGLEESQGLAHDAEELLVWLREGGGAPSVVHQELLLLSVDSLRGLVGGARLRGSEQLDVHGAGVAELRSELRAAVSASKRAGTAVGAAKRAGTEEERLEEETRGEQGVAAPQPTQAMSGAGTQVERRAALGLERPSLRIPQAQFDRIWRQSLALEALLCPSTGRRRSTRAPSPAVQQARQLRMDLEEARLKPIGELFDGAEQLARQLSRQMGKPMQILGEGRSVRIDATVLEQLREPLPHLVRNALDHGVEASTERARQGKPLEATLRLTAQLHDGELTLTVEDDGGGVDLDQVRRRAVERQLVSASDVQRLSAEETLRLLFRPGFSTATQVTLLSGRGVGLDVVESLVREAGGTVRLDSERGQGARVTLRLPCPLARVEVDLVRWAGRLVAVQSPLVRVRGGRRAAARLGGRDLSQALQRLLEHGGGRARRSSLRPARGIALALGVRAAHSPHAAPHAADYLLAEVHLGRRSVTRLLNPADPRLSGALLGTVASDEGPAPLVDLRRLALV
jgi:two-component system chemotaxis sensor kinase CheA